MGKTANMIDLFNRKEIDRLLCIIKWLEKLIKLCDIEDDDLIKFLVTNPIPDSITIDFFSEDNPRGNKPKKD